MSEEKKELEVVEITSIEIVQPGDCVILDLFISEQKKKYLGVTTPSVIGVPPGDEKG